MGNWERLVWNQRDVFIAGFVVTLEVCLIAFAFAILGGLVLCLTRLYVKPLRPVAVFLIEFFRDTPIFVQLMWVSYVWPELFGFPKSFFAAGWLALGLQSSGYLAETFRAGIEGVPRGQREAAFSAGMSPAQTFARIVMPQVALASAPSIVNQFVSLFKATTIVSLIAVPDLMYDVSMVTQQEMRPLPLYTGAAITYFLIIFALSVGVRHFSERWRRKILA